MNTDPIKWKYKPVTKEEKEKALEGIRRLLGLGKMIQNDSKATNSPET